MEPYKHKLHFDYYKSAVLGENDHSLISPMAWNKKEGVYKSYASEEVVFTSKDKVNSITKPTFVKPANEKMIETQPGPKKFWIGPPKY